MKLSNERHNLFDIVFKLVSGIFILVAFIIGLSQFKFESKLEFKKIYFTNQISYINELTEVTSELCNPFLESEDEDLLIKSFRSLYYGKMEYYLDNKALKDEIEHFNSIVTYIENGKTIFRGGGATNHATKESAKEIAKLAKKYVDELYGLQH
jgi:hypothetical protein